MYGWAGVLMKVKSLIAVIWTAPEIITFDTVILCYDLRMQKIRASFVMAIAASQQTSLRNIRDEVSVRPVQSSEKCQPPPAPGARLGDGSSYANQDGNGLQPPQFIHQMAHKRSPGVPNNDELLRNVNYALTYIEDLVSVYPTSPRTKGQKRPPRFQSQCTDKSATYLRCTWTTIESLFTNKPSFDLRWRVAIHMTASGQHPIWRWPRLVDRMYTLGLKSKPPDWRHVAIASDILLTRIPLVITSKTWMVMAAWQLAFIVFMVLQVELTIAWNYVTRLSSLSSLGQLIPFIIGVGGLGKVLWGKWRLVQRGMGDGDGGRDGDRKGEYEKAMEAFWRWRTRDVAGKGVARAATA